jgi:hypothetical protein
MIRLFFYRTILITISIFFFNVSFCQEIISEREIAEMAEKLDKESAGLSLIDGVVMRGCKSHKRRIIFQYDVVDNWIPVDNLKEYLEKNALKNLTFKKFCDKNEIDKTFVYYYASGEVAKLVTLFHDKDSKLSTSLGDFVSIKGHKKSKGIDLKLRCPIDWKVEEADRPNIVKKFTHEGGAFMIITTNNVTFFSKDESKKFLIESEEVLIPNFITGLESSGMKQNKVLKKKMVLIDRYPALEVEIKGTADLSLTSFKSDAYCKVWYMFLEDKIITFMSMTYKEPFSYVDKISTKIINTVVFPEQYMN